MFDNLSLSFQSIWNHKTRSFLTMLGIIIGIASIITIVSTIKGTNDQIKENLIGSGNNVVTVSLSSTTGAYMGEGSPDAITGVGVVDDEILEKIRQISGVKDVSAFVYKSWAENTYYMDTAFEGEVYGIDDNYLKTNGLSVTSGRNFNSDDFEKCRKVLLIDSKLVNDLQLGETPVGQVIEIKGEPFTIIGIVENSNKSNVVINSVEDYYTYSDTSSGSIYMPITSWPIVYNYDAVKSVSVRANTTDEMSNVGKKAAEILTDSLITSEDYKYEADNLLEQATQLQSLANSTNQQLIWIAGIALLVGGIGVMNIMLVSVTERTREIGLKKALGAKKKRIMWQFLTEAGTLTSLGGIIGVIAGIVLAMLLSKILGTPAAISVPACIIAVVFSMAIGVAFGLIPAVKAAKLNPIDALRRD